MMKSKKKEEGSEMKGGSKEPKSKKAAKNTVPQKIDSDISDSVIPELNVLNTSAQNDETPKSKKPRKSRKKNSDIADNGILPALDTDGNVSHDNVPKVKKQKLVSTDSGSELENEESTLQEENIEQSHENIDPDLMDDLLNGPSFNEKQKASKRKRKQSTVIEENEHNHEHDTNEDHHLDEMIENALETESDEEDISPLLQQQEHPEEIANTITWPEKDLSELFRRMESAIPEKDTLAFSTRTEKLNWDTIAFNEYSAEECKSTWILVQKRLRKFRILSEVLQDAKEWISKPWTDFYRGSKNKRHPEFPKRPLSRYMIYYLKKKDKILKEHPKMEMTDVSKMIAKMYKNLSPAKQEKYTKLATKYREEYDKKLEAFYLLHPELKIVDKATHSKPIETGPKKPQTPFGLFYLNQLKSVEHANIDKNLFKDKCKEQWKTLSDKKKVVWINWAEEEEIKYQEELKNYMIQNPDFVPAHTKSVLTKEERLLKERMAGKPVKPPSSAYSLFSQIMLQSEEIKKVSPKERMNVIATNWKLCSEDEKKVYKERVQHLMEQYKLNFASYLESLSEEKRQEALMNIQPKRKAKPIDEESPSKKVKTNTKSNKQSEQDQVLASTIRATESPPQQELTAPPVQSAENEIVEPSTPTTTKTTETPSAKKRPSRRSLRGEGTQNQASAAEKKDDELSPPEEPLPPPPRVEVDNIEDDAAIFKKEPKQPPKTAYDYFLLKYSQKTGKDPNKKPEDVWENFSRVTKRKYEKELDDLKHAYLLKFERFLKTMSKPRLKRYIKLKAEQEALENEQNEAQNQEEAGEPEEQDENYIEPKEEMDESKESEQIVGEQDETY